MKRYYTMILIFAFAAAWTGCSAGGSASEKDLGSHHVTIKPGSALTTSSSTSSGGVSTYQFSSGDTTVKISNEELFVNGTSYGKLNAGDAVLVDNGKVSVAGQPREASE